MKRNKLKEKKGRTDSSNRSISHNDDSPLPEEQGRYKDMKRERECVCVFEISYERREETGERSETEDHTCIKGAIYLSSQQCPARKKQVSTHKSNQQEIIEVRVSHRHTPKGYNA